MFLVRKIEKDKWSPKNGVAEGEIPAEGITHNLKTKNNSLSFWRCDNEGDIKDIALAIATTRDKLAPVDIVWVSHEGLKADIGGLKDSDGETPLKDMIDRHVDASGLDHNRLCRVAEHVVAAINENRYKRLSKGDLRDFAKQAIRDGRIDINDLDSSSWLLSEIP